MKHPPEVTSNLPQAEFFGFFVVFACTPTVYTATTLVELFL